MNGVSREPSTKPCAGRASQGEASFATSLWSLSYKHSSELHPSTCLCDILHGIDANTV